jgi:ribonuclease Z
LNVVRTLRRADISGVPTPVLEAGDVVTAERDDYYLCMSISLRILGQPGRDNALLATIDSGQAIFRLLFDCGEATVSELPFAEIMAIERVFFSHLHMDHIGGFDSYFRATYDGRSHSENRFWGPAETSRILQHRFQGYMWNLNEQMHARWSVTDILPDRLQTTHYNLGESFAIAHPDAPEPFDGVVEARPEYSVSALVMDHKTPSIAYIVREAARRNIDTSRLAAMGLRPGPWLKQLKDDACPKTLSVGGVERSTEELRAALLVETPGDAIAYLTDFLLDDAAIDRLVPALAGCGTVVCEAQYRQADLELAIKNYHMTTARSALLAQRAGIRELVLFHLSDRYQPDEWREMLCEAKAIFPNTRFPEHWAM